jgi:hypothetical protein
MGCGKSVEQEAGGLQERNILQARSLTVRGNLWDKKSEDRINYC